MAFGFTKSHPLLVIQRRLAAVMKSANKVAPRLRRERPRAGRVVAELLGPRSNLAALRSRVRREARALSSYGSVSRDGTWDIGDSLARLVSDLSRLDRTLSPADAQWAKRILSGVFRETDKLAKAAVALEGQVASERVRVVERHPRFSEHFIKVREALAALNPEEAEILEGSDVDDLCEWPAFDPEDPVQVKRIAKLVLLDREAGREYRLCHQLDKPGRPLVQQPFLDFPSPDDVEEYALAWDRPLRIYAAVTKPTWRRVWVFRRERSGWYW